jgi:hypothetical protein
LELVDVYAFERSRLAGIPLDLVSICEGERRRVGWHGARLLVRAAVLTRTSSSSPSMANDVALEGAVVRDNGVYDGAWRYTVEVPSVAWRLHVAPTRGEVFWLYEPGESRADEPRFGLEEMPSYARRLIESALAAGPPSAASSGSKHAAQTAARVEPASTK